jgi:hypothetical protein
MRWKKWRKPLTYLVVVLVGFAAVFGPLLWWKFYKPTPQDAATANYGLADVHNTSVPYLIFMALPRIFPDLIETYAHDGYDDGRSDQGGYAAFEFAWDEGEPLPKGFTIRRQGYQRVTANCALCHQANDPKGLGPVIAPPKLRGFNRFLAAAAKDARFNYLRVIAEIRLNYKLDPIDYLVYAWLIPETRVLLRRASAKLNQPDTPIGPGPVQQHRASAAVR